MKKFFSIVIFSLICFSCLQISNFPLHATKVTGSIPIPDEALVKKFLQKTYATTMIFEGSNQNWDCSYTVFQTILKNNPEEDSCPKIKVSLSPKFSFNNLRKYNYRFHTTHGCIWGEKWLESNNQWISFETHAPIPENNEKIILEIIENNKKESFKLSNVIPPNIVTFEEALRTTLKVYYQTYGFYPTSEFTFEIQFLNYVYWLITIDDHNGIGGLAYLTINAFTGEAGAIREDE